MTSSSPLRLPLLLGLVAVVVSLAFAAFTGHMWEDYFITFRASLNLANGHGLVFQPGERVHSFTSPLGTLLPALFALGGGDDVAIRAIWGLRVVSAFALGGALWLAVRAFQRDSLVTVGVVAVGLGWALDPKIVDFSMNGMETAFVVFFVTLTWHAFTSGARLWPCAVACTGLQWTRPDGCVFFAVIALAWMLFGAAPAGFSVRQRFTRVAAAIALGIVLYLPWLITAWVYYGSPIPHTILAKSAHLTLVETATKLALYPWRLLFGQTALLDVFRPAYFFFGGWPEALAWPARVLSVGAALAWLWPRVAPAGRMGSFAFFLGGFYVTYIPIFPWYYPGWQTLALITWAYLLHALWSTRPPVSWAVAIPPAATRITAALLVILQAGLLACVAWQMRTQQALVETGHRREIGLWLRDQAAPGDTVFLEPLGYIGYFSGLKMLDFPGLCAPEVVAARRAGHSSFAQVITALQPDWLVLRPGEGNLVFSQFPELRKTYSFVRAFDIRAAIDAIPALPGRGYLKFDAVFLVYRRADAAESRP
jgi:hypothetical protein